MCLACYPQGAVPKTTTAPAPVPAPAPPASALRFAVPGQGWSCFPSGQMGGMQMIPPPPIVIKKPAKPAAEPAPAVVKADEKPKKKKARPSAPPSLMNGAAYVFPRKHTYVHVIRDVKVWDGKVGDNWGFKIHRVPTSLSVGEFLDAMSGGEEEATKGLACTEVIEIGDGKWDKVCAFCEMVLESEVADSCGRVPPSSMVPTAPKALWRALAGMKGEELKVDCLQSGWCCTKARELCQA
ncbi:hypothetical protein ANO11243_000160 [Dothideomycetidae sp. 11243]|nr:hypothetical protein ANO11243_000160 [fungal sp. No.11243]